jgi:cytochrome c peroxidase
LERAIITALARITSQKEEDFLKEVGKHKQRNPLGVLINTAEKALGNQYDWFDAPALRNITNRRNFIHDALVQELDGTLVWQSNSLDRKHRAVDYYDLLALKADAKRAIIQINEGSLKAKTR